MINPVRHLDRLVCPHCRARLSERPEGLQCIECNQAYPLEGSQIRFLPEGDVWRMRRGWAFALKKHLRRSPPIWWLIKLVFSSALLFHNKPGRLFQFVGPDPWILNLGSGASRFPGDVTNIDISDDDDVDWIASIDSLPVADECVDGVICAQVLEHCRDPKAIVDECYRVIKPGGYMYLAMPFILELHLSPDDYYRWTLSGLRELCSDWSIVDCGPNAGPASAWYAISRSLLAIMLSFGSRRLYRVALVAVGVFLWPLKLLDFALSFLPTAEYLFASGYILCRKPPERA